MRIAYGVHGYGRGHSSRALAVLPALAGRHELLVLAGDDAYEALHREYRVVPIPVLRYALAPGGRRSGWRTIARAIPHMADLKLAGPALRGVCDALADFRPDVVVSDSDPWTHHAARRLKLPRISFDHFGVLVYCDWPMSAAQRAVCRMEGFSYHRLMGGPADRIVIVSFYAPPARREGVCVVGPVLREAVRARGPSCGEYLLVYFSNGPYHFTPPVERALHAVDCPVVVYGVGREGADGNVQYRPPSNVEFVEDLAGAKAVFATAGNQLISEALYFRKPLLLLPEDSLEQRLNAAAIERMGVGMQTRRDRVSAEQLRGLVAGREGFAARMPPDFADGRALAVEAIERFAEELRARP